MTGLRRRRRDENCWCGALSGEPCLSVRSYAPMRTYTHLIPEES